MKSPQNIHPDNYHVIKDKSFYDRHDREYLKYREIWDKTAAEHIVTPFPLHLDIEITSYCNLKCPMCPRTHRVNQGEWENKHLSFELFKKIIDEGTSKGLKAVNLNNFGEPLLHKKLCEMINYAKQKGIIDIMLHTNGTILTKVLSEKLIKSGLDQIIFSVDSITKSTYEKIRINADFEKTVQNIKDFAGLKKQLKSLFPIIRISMVLMKENADEEEDFEYFWKDTADMISFTDYRNQDNLDNENRYVKEKSRNGSFVCSSLWQRMTINVDGRVTACCRDADKRLLLGIYDGKCGSLQDIWEGDILKEARRLHLEGKAFQIGACSGCDHIKGSQLH